MFKKMPKRDFTGKCEGGCSDRVQKGENQGQISLEKEAVNAPLWPFNHLVSSPMIWLDCGGGLSHRTPFGVIPCTGLAARLP